MRTIKGLTRTEREAVVRGDLGDPFALLGMHKAADGHVTLRTFQPRADHVWGIDAAGGIAPVRLRRTHDAGLFEATFENQTEKFPYHLRLDVDGAVQEIEDPYRFPLILGDFDIHLFAEGRHLHLYRKLGAHPMTMDGVEGVAFLVWAPNASRVSVVGDFNHWDGRCHPLRKRIECGVWELFVPDWPIGGIYKFEVKGPHGELLPLKSDPVAFAAEQAPRTGSVVHGLHHHPWTDSDWLAARHQVNDRHAPISIYECHLGSWKRGEEGRLLTYRELADQLIPYVKDMGFTHLQLLPISEHPFAGSWGYQPIGLFAPTSRHGTPEDFAHFVNCCHEHDLALFLDWVPAHFPADVHGLAGFDGTHLYEHADRRKGWHPDWDTLIYNYGRHEVVNFLLSNALYWLQHFHVDGLRVDAVASMLYLDYSRPEGHWLPNPHGGNENLEAIDFLRRLNELVFRETEGAATAAEESTAWPGVSRPVDAGGLGFGYKWNMGWMHDTLSYMRRDPVHRRYHHSDMTFGLLYAFDENFILPLSHDEVVHGKGSLLNKMPGDEWQRFANLRAYFGFMFGHPGKKLLFMGSELAERREWNHDAGLDWELGHSTAHVGVQRLIRDLNQLYRTEPGLHEWDCLAEGFTWLDLHNAEQSVFAFMRRGRSDDRIVVVICNFTPGPRSDYRQGVPLPGGYELRINTDAAIYGGSDFCRDTTVLAEPIASHGQPFSLNLNLPPLATLILARHRP